MGTQIKICGITSIEDVKIVNQCKPDYIGCVLYYPKSKRNISPDLAKKLMIQLDSNIKKVAVAVSPTIQQIRDIKMLGFDYIQIHGEWDKEVISNSTMPIIWAINMKNEQLDTNSKKLSDMIGKCENIPKLSKTFYEHLDIVIKSDRIYGVLFDSGTSGSGETFLWNSICKAQKMVAKKGKKVFLAGGLKVENVTRAIYVAAPDVVDVSSGVEFENQPSRIGKDEKRVEDFIKAVRMKENGICDSVLLDTNP